MIFDDKYYMSKALELAKKAWGKATPNPMVGAVIVDDGKIVAQGYHKKNGDAHAEKSAIKKLKKPLGKNATMYVTLEPCSTKGRTGACTEAILNAGIKNIVIGTLDPNPAHNGASLDFFKKHKISARYSVLKKECEDLNFIFNHIIKNKNAILIAKFAASKNFKIAKKLGNPIKISSKESSVHLHKLRALTDSIGVGSKTLFSDNPKLTVRAGNKESCKARLIFDRRLLVADCDLKKFNLFSDKFKSRTFVVCDLDSPKEKISLLKKHKIKVLQVASKRCEEKLFWKLLSEKLFEMKIYSLLIEGGSEIFKSLLESKSTDYFFVYISEKIFSDSAPNAVSEKFQKKILSADKIKLGKDTLYFSQC